MALVMLPCDLPWWDSVKKYLKRISNTRNTLELIEGMQKIHDMCNVSLDPEEDTNEPDLFIGLLNFLDNDLTSEERSVFLSKTLPNIVKRALGLKETKPKGGLHFSLQQQSDSTELEYSFISALIANAFFSTFPKRSDRTHPTLQNFNFTHFFKHLDKNVQKAKLRSILHYFDWLEEGDNDQGCLKISRQVMTSKEWLTIEDWLECSLPLCSLHIKHEGKLERAESDSLQMCFASSKIGGNVLSDGNTQECINLVTYPELLAVLLNVEALEDNEVVTIERVRHISRIVDPKNRASLEKLDNPQEVTICCADADDYKKIPIGQYEEDNILRELNKCLLAFQQKQHKPEPAVPQLLRLRRLSPIGESVGSAQSDPAIPLITQQSCSTNRSTSPILPCDNNNISNSLRVQLEVERNLPKKGQTNAELVNSRRGRFIVLGSSGECLPVTRKPRDSPPKSIYSSCESSEEEFLSAKTSLDDGSEDENFHKRYSIDLETPERRHTFAQRLRDALRREVDSLTSSESSYAVGISVTGSNVHDHQIKVKRGGSTGFALKEESLDESFLQSSLQQEKEWIDNYKSKQPGLIRKESNKSSEYSFSTEYSSELEEVYEQFSRWLQNPILETDRGTKKELQGRELAIVQFAGSLLKRTLSESFAGVPVPLAESRNIEEHVVKKSKLVLSAKSLSLELARQKHKLAAQLIDSQPVEPSCNLAAKKRKTWFISCVTEAIVQTLEDISFSISMPRDKQISQISQKPSNGLKSVSTGNWGCGSSKSGDVQLKVIVQWLAASVAGIPSLRYYTYGHPKLAKLDTVCRILIDRKWNVKDLAQATLRYSNQVLHGREDGDSLFEELIGIERSS